MNKILLGFLLFIIGVSNSYSQLIANEIQKIISTNGIQNDYFGSSVFIDGNRAIVGATHTDNGFNPNTSVGSAYIFEFDGSNWIQTAILQPSDGNGSDYFGCSVMLNDSLAIIGAFNKESNGNNVGAAYIFKFNGANWSEITKLTPPDGNQSDDFGISVSINDSYAVIGAVHNNNIVGTDAGAAYIYEFNGMNWVFHTKLMPLDGLAYDLFGRSVSISENRIIVGCEAARNSFNVGTGAAYIFEYDGINWIQSQKLFASDGQGFDAFGHAVSIKGTLAIIGAYGDDDLGTDSGSAYIFEFNGSNWFQKVKLHASDGANSDNFGYSVSITDDKAAVGAWRDDDILGTDIGAAYVYKNINSNWTEIIKASASDSNPINGGTRLGFSVSIDKEFLFAGAPYFESAYLFKVRGVIGKIFQDFNQNCFLDTPENGLNNRIAVITPGNFVVETNLAGNWYIDSIPTGNYLITYDTSGYWIPTCVATQNFSVTNSDSLTFAPNFGLLSTAPCPKPTISINMPQIRPCFSDQKIFIQACNNTIATEILNNGYVDIELDSLIIPTSASLNYTNLGGNMYRFILPNNNLYPGQCENFWISTDISCDAVLGQTLCIQANLYPADSCVFDTIPADVPGDFTPCNLPWDKSSISINGWCENDSIYFTITNTGDFGNGDMDCYSPMRLFIDGQYIWLDSIQLLGGETDTLVFSGDGRTWRLEVDQHPLHPGNSHPNATVERCGNLNNWTSNLVNILPMDDADPIVDIYCGVVTGSYDPNDKTGYPLGVTDSHYVQPNGKLEYVIRFQNTGTDTAFTVVVRDTLDLDLNIFSVVSGASSHNYSFRMYGPRILEWTFNNILLPDSTTDEPGSNGFVTFEVNQMPNLPDGTEINNEVGIYFDYNAPVITNTTSHIINRNIHEPDWNEQLTITDTACFEFIYNNSMYTQSGEYFTINNDTLVTLNLSILPFILDAGSDTTICLNESITLFGNGALSYVWDNSVINGVSFTPNISDTYHVSATDLNGCAAIDSITIMVNDTIPNSDFTYSFNNTEITLQDLSSNDVNYWIWTLDGDTISNQNTVQYLFTQNGSYEVCLFVSNDCFNDSTCKQIDITTIGINDLNSTSEIKIYPNPTHSNFTIETSELNNSPFEITDITGKIIYTGNLKDKLTNVDLSNVANGIYLLRIENQSIKIIRH